MKQKKLFNNLFLLLVISLIVLPFIVAFNDFLTKAIESIGVYSAIQEYIVPIETKMVIVLVSPLGIKLQLAKEGIMVNGMFAKITWNCIGWQSLLLFFISLIIGFQGKYTRISKLEAFAIGLLGIFIINLFRMSFIIILLSYSQSLFAVVFHDYLAAFVTIGYLFIFWWFAYKYVLEEK